jgi:hypothetical protein
MSGHAATVSAIRTIEDSSEPHIQNCLGKLTPPGRGKSPFSLDCYLSWMSSSPTNRNIRGAVYRSVTMYGVQNSISDTLSICHHLRPISPRGIFSKTNENRCSSICRLAHRAKHSNIVFDRSTREVFYCGRIVLDMRLGHEITVSVLRVRSMCSNTRFYRFCR